MILRSQPRLGQLGFDFLNLLRLDNVYGGCDLSSTVPILCDTGYNLFLLSLCLFALREMKSVFVGIY